MKQIIYILTITVGLLSCNNQPKHVDKKPIANITAETKKVENSKYYTQQDIILITTEIGETLKYNKEKFNQIVDNFPALYKDNVQDPDFTYFSNDIWKDIVDKNGNEVHLTFGSEVGRDEYYTLYAYFLKQKNGINKFAQQRQKLIDIYLNINSLFGHFEYGGTYFGHQSRRILGYAEYSIYLLPKTKEDILKTYDITKQKELYIKSLQQLIEDESKIDFNTLGQEKIERNKELNKIVDELDKLITDLFYLRRAQEFQYGHYEYY